MEVATGAGAGGGAAARFGMMLSGPAVGTSILSSHRSPLTRLGMVFFLDQCVPSSMACGSGNE